MSIEKMVKMMFEYFRAIPEHIVTRNSYNVSESCAYRACRVFGHIVTRDSYNVSKSCAYRTIKHVEEVLIIVGNMH
ncbi:hypothetical protein AGMMS49950_02750 [Endomicrobiia bacterium]|nr:hypothetical protein AGMMS49531_03010 [Endomicrobiia bacterium]GHT69630.1 hypothetical protein AGMMS49950_02750 [Endomicrobiia bacterium]